eukprot:gnl/Trimastix_PCT/2233.p1 GENE.gnl/Trimastix_PCT/2233~~gnl/Trimastix_PCT/2233.p1  ORF type:complete len:359 (+),score=37.84 gnl/Trimastix_PCT/2233:66-1142(+)
MATIPGKANAPLNYAGDYQAFPHNANRKKRREEVHHFLEKKPMGMKPAWNSSTLTTTKFPEHAPQRELSRFQPLSQSRPYDFHSPQPLTKNPITCVPRPNKFSLDPTITMAATLLQTGASGRPSKAPRATSNPPDEEGVNAETTLLGLRTDSARERDARDEHLHIQRIQSLPHEAQRRANAKGGLRSVSPEGALEAGSHRDRERATTADTEAGPRWNPSTLLDPRELSAGAQALQEAATQRSQLRAPVSRPTLIQRERAFHASMRETKENPELVRQQEALANSAAERQMAAERRKLRKQMERTRGKPSIHTERCHPGVYEHVAVEGRSMWSCCAAYREDAPGCSVKRVNLDSWEYSGF